MGEPTVTADTGRSVTLELGGRRVEVQFDGETQPIPRAAMLRWVQEAMRSVAAFYGRLPVAELRLTISLRPGSGIDDGVTRIAEGRPHIRVRVGDATDARTFASDWVLTHEMVHTALPCLDQRQHWLEEGLATYVEPIGRARAGLESDGDVWRQLIEGLPKGQPQRGDQGLDHTHTWGRTYWGGAMFCLLADLGIRERTGNRSGLRDALRALVDSGFTMERSAAIEDVLARMDSAVGVPVLSELYHQHAAVAVRIDLPDLWRRLGVALDHGRVRFDDTAPQAPLRRAIIH